MNGEEHALTILTYSKSLGDFRTKLLPVSKILLKKVRFQNAQRFASAIQMRRTNKPDEEWYAVAVCDY